MTKTTKTDYELVLKQTVDNETIEIIDKLTKMYILQWVGK